MYPRGRRAWIVGLAVAIAAAVVIFGVILGTRGSSKDTVISSTVAAPTASCIERGAKVSVENAHFAAFEGALRPHAGGKLLLVDVKLDDAASQTARLRAAVGCCPTATLGVWPCSNRFVGLA